LTFLSGMPLKKFGLICGGTAEISLKPLAVSPLEELYLAKYAGSDLKGLKGCGLKKIGLADCPELTDIQVLRGMPLEVVSIDGCPKLRDIGALQTATNLTHVDIENSPVADLAPLKGLSIQRVDLVGTTVRSIDVLQTLPELKIVAMQKCPNLKDITPLANCKRLVELRIDVDPSELGFLRNLPALNRLSCGKGTNRVEKAAGNMADLWKDDDAKKK